MADTAPDLYPDDDAYTDVPPDRYLDLKEHRPLVRVWLSGDLETPTVRTRQRGARTATESGPSAHRTVEVEVQVPDTPNWRVEVCQAVARALYRELAADSQH